jgi:hypothetical protein
VVNSAQGWTLAAFLHHLDMWTKQEQPSDDLRLRVTAWIMTRYDNPYQGVQREPGFDNLWFGAIPGSIHSSDRVVACSYWIYESTRTVSCNSISTLSLPL